MVTIFVSSDLGDLTLAPVTPATCWRFCFTPGNAILLNGACCFAPGNAVLLNGVSQPHQAQSSCNGSPVARGGVCGAPRLFPASQGGLDPVSKPVRPP